jgi:hypothetical protein
MTKKIFFMKLRKKKGLKTVSNKLEANGRKVEEETK